MPMALLCEAPAVDCSRSFLASVRTSMEVNLVVRRELPLRFRPEFDSDILGSYEGLSDKFVPA